MNIEMALKSKSYILDLDRFKLSLGNFFFLSCSMESFFAPAFRIYFFSSSKTHTKSRKFNVWPTFTCGTDSCVVPWRAIQGFTLWITYESKQYYNAMYFVVVNLVICVLPYMLISLHWDLRGTSSPQHCNLQTQHDKRLDERKLSLKKIYFECAGIQSSTKKLMGHYGELLNQRIYSWAGPKDLKGIKARYIGFSQTAKSATSRNFKCFWGLHHTAHGGFIDKLREV